MKKKISLILVNLIASTAIATASTSEKMNLATLSPSDTHMLFGQNTHRVTMLNQVEMKNTEGEWGWFIPLFFGWATSIANAPAPKSPTYHGTIPSHYFQVWWR
ncbi:MAG: hypothetical protein KU38_08805 [Sulfurovum sp. FS08-3]|nr:MAG: hypothetical protein KU38_08805 [Sulfurovum sp. FS08-3]